MDKLPEIPGYRLVRMLKESKRSSTFLAEQQSLARQVALKVLSEEFFEEPSLRQRFIDEGKSAARLNHPNVLAVFDIGSAGGCPFIATEFVPGGTLRDRLQRPMAPVEALRIARDLANALDYAHSQGVVHSDIKPANILFRTDGAAVLADLGILRTQSAGIVMQAGSPHYMSPEQIEGQHADGRADLYSLGVVLYEMLTGKLPYDADDPFAVIAKHLSDPIPRLPESLASFQPLIDQTLAKSADGRFADAQTMVQALDAFIEPKPGREAKAAARPAARELAVAPAKAAKVAEPPAAPVETVVQAAVPLERSATRVLLPPGRPAKSNPLKALTRIALVLLVLAAIVAAVWYALRPGDVAQGDTDAEPTVVATRQLAGTQGGVEVDLARAERLLASRQWLSPPGENALEAFEKVLKADPGNRRAVEGIRRVAQAMKAQIRVDLAAGAVSNAETLLQRARIAFPDDPELPQLESEIAASAR